MKTLPSTLVVKPCLLLLLITLCLVALTTGAVAFPSQMTYQGEIPGFTGKATTYFAIINIPDPGTPTINYWTNDGSSPAAGSVPFHGITTYVNNGKYSLDLGDTHYGYMTPLWSSVFVNDQLYLRVWYRAGSSPLTRIYPDKRLVCDPFAYNAIRLNGILAGNASGNIPISNNTVNTNLNADKLDGNHASAFAVSGHNHDAAYVNVTGDTMTGNLTVPKIVDANNTTYYVDPAGSSIFNTIDDAYWIDAHIFYDEDNIGYYLDPDSKSNLNDLNLNGKLWVTGVVTTSNYITTPGLIDKDNTSYYLNPAGYSNLDNVNVAGVLDVQSWINAPVLYDLNNVSYYVNPAGASMMSTIYTAALYDKDNASYYVDPNAISYLNNLTLDGQLIVGANSGNGYIKHFGDNEFEMRSEFDIQMVLDANDNDNTEWFEVGTGSGNTQRMHVWGPTGDMWIDGSYLSGFTDLAEKVPTLGQMEAGDVLVIDPNVNDQFILSSTPFDTKVAGIVSSNPGFVLGNGKSEKIATLEAKIAQAGKENDTVAKNTFKKELQAAEQEGINLALSGRVPCKVSAENGAIKRGDLLVTSNTPGYAMKAIDPPTGTVLGKALESLDSGTGTIKVLVCLQ